MESSVSITAPKEHSQVTGVIHEFDAELKRAFADTEESRRLLAEIEGGGIKNIRGQVLDWTLYLERATPDEIWLVEKAKRLSYILRQTGLHQFVQRGSQLQTQVETMTGYAEQLRKLRGKLRLQLAPPEEKTVDWLWHHYSPETFKGAAVRIFSDENCPRTLSLIQDLQGNEEKNSEMLTEAIRLELCVTPDERRLTSIAGRVAEWVSGTLYEEPVRAKIEAKLKQSEEQRKLRSEYREKLAPPGVTEMLQGYSQTTLYNRFLYTYDDKEFLREVDPDFRSAQAFEET